jgi:hypothetical protein
MLYRRESCDPVGQSSIAAVNRDVDIEDGSINEGDRAQFVEGMYQGEGFVIKRHRWMITVYHFKLAHRVRVWPSSENYCM